MFGYADDVGPKVPHGGTPDHKVVTQGSCGILALTGPELGPRQPHPVPDRADPVTAEPCAEENHRCLDLSGNGRQREQDFPENCSTAGISPV